MASIYEYFEDTLQPVIKAVCSTGARKCPTTQLKTDHILPVFPRGALGHRAQRRKIMRGRERGVERENESQ